MISRLFTVGRHSPSVRQEAKLRLFACRGVVRDRTPPQRCCDIWSNAGMLLSLILTIHEKKENNKDSINEKKTMKRLEQDYQIGAAWNCWRWFGWGWLALGERTASDMLWMSRCTRSFHMSQHNRDIPKICENVSTFCHILEMASTSQVAQGQ